MGNIQVNLDQLEGFMSQDQIFSFREEINRHFESIRSKTGKGNDFLGWVDLPELSGDDLLSSIEDSAYTLAACSEIIIVTGIGGSYLGARAVIDALNHQFASLLSGRKSPLILYAGHNIGEDYLTELLDILDQRDYSIIVISKSGTTTEPAIAFRILKEHLEEKAGPAEANQRIIAITDKSKGALRKLSDKLGYRSFIIPDDVGGRYSVLTPVGLLPIACAGYDIREFIKGAIGLKEQTGPDTPFRENPAALYAAARNALYRNGRSIEILANYNEKLIYFSEWWKQLYGESEGKENKGIFPASVNFTADLHSMGQYIQEGERILFETVISVSNPDRHLSIPEDEGNLDQLNYLAGKRINEVNKMAELGTLLAHIDGGVPNMRIEIPAINEYHLGELVYFFEIACGISGYLLDVNPFNQPGVEAYKKNMFALLEKPGFEDETRAIQERLNKK